MNLLIVDDEKWTREGIAESIGNEPGISAVAMADSGVGAIAELDRFQPDIILTDVRMPLMDGIELVSRIRSRLPDCKIIFMSGYSDKDYLKSAIKLKALNYIEKPIDQEELREALTAAIALRSEEERAKRRSMELSRSFLESIPLLKAEIALELTGENPAVETLLSRAAAAGLRIPRRAVFRTVILHCPSRGGEMRSPALTALRKRIGSSAESFFVAAGRECLSALHEESYVCHLYGGSGPIGERELRRLAERLLAEAETECIHLTIACGTEAAGLEQIHRSYRHAASLLPMSFYYESGAVIPDGERLGQAYAPDPSLLAAFKACVGGEHQEEAERLLEAVADRLRQHRHTPVEHAKDLYLTLLLALFPEQDAGAPAEAGKAPLWDVLNRFAALRDLHDFAVQTLRGRFKELGRMKGTNRIVREVIRYIQSSYADETLSIQKICEHTYLTPAYLCSLFKAHTDRTINGFLTEVRIERAKAFMADPKLTIQQIAAMVGYSNSNYFAKVFRKTVGMKPTEYRERMAR